MLRQGLQFSLVISLTTLQISGDQSTVWWQKKNKDQLWWQEEAEQQKYITFDDAKTIESNQPSYTFNRFSSFQKKNKHKSINSKKESSSLVKWWRSLFKKRENQLSQRQKYKVTLDTFKNISEVHSEESSLTKNKKEEKKKFKFFSHLLEKVRKKNKSKEKIIEVDLMPKQMSPDEMDSLTIPQKNRPNVEKDFRLTGERSEPTVIPEKPKNLSNSVKEIFSQPSKYPEEKKRPKVPKLNPLKVFYTWAQRAVGGATDITEPVEVKEEIRKLTSSVVQIEEKVIDSEEIQTNQPLKIENSIPLTIPDSNSQKNWLNDQDISKLLSQPPIVSKSNQTAPIEEVATDDQTQKTKNEATIPLKDYQFNEIWSKTRKPDSIVETPKATEQQITTLSNKEKPKELRQVLLSQVSKVDHPNKLKSSFKKPKFSSLGQTIQKLKHERSKKGSSEASISSKKKPLQVDILKKKTNKTSLPTKHSPQYTQDLGQQLYLGRVLGSVSLNGTPCTENQKLFKNNILLTGKDGRAVLYFTPTSKAILSPNSEIFINWVNWQNHSFDISIKRGNVSFDIKDSKVTLSLPNVKLKLTQTRVDIQMKDQTLNFGPPTGESIRVYTHKNRQWIHSGKSGHIDKRGIVRINKRSRFTSIYGNN